MTRFATAAALALLVGSQADAQYIYSTPVYPAYYGTGYVMPATPVVNSGYFGPSYTSGYYPAGYVTPAYTSGYYSTGYVTPPYATGYYPAGYATPGVVAYPRVGFFGRRYWSY